MAAFTRASVLLLVSLLVAGCKSGDARDELSAADASVPIWTLSTKSEEARKHIEEGERAADEGRLLTAYQQFKRAVASDSAFAYGYLRVSQFGQSFDEQRTNLQRAEAYESSANDTEKLLIDIARKVFSRDQQGALETAQQLVAKQPKNPRALWALATRQFASGQVAEARASLKKAVDLAPQYGATHLNYGNSFLLEPKDVAKAELEILAGQKLWPNQPVSYDYLGDVRRAEGRLQEAAAAYTRQIELSPTEPEGHSQRGHAYTFLGQYDKARTDYDAAIRLGKENEPAAYAYYRALVDVYAGYPEKGIAGLEQLVQAIDGMGIPDPEDGKIAALSDEAVIASHIHKFDVAERAVSRLDSLERKQGERSGNADVKRGVEADAAYWEGRLAAFRGDYPLAQRKVTEFMKLTEPERNPTKNRRAHAVLGFIALFQKHYDVAVKEFEQGDPDNIYQKYERALALEGAGRAAEAKALFKEVANYNFNAPGYGLVRGDAVARAR